MKWFRWQITDDDGYYKSFPVSKLTDKNNFAFKIKNNELITAKYKNEIYVFDNVCPHRNLSLIKSHFEENYLICNHHNLKFKLDTGECISNTNYCLKKYPIKIYKDYIWVKI